LVAGLPQSEQNSGERLKYMTTWTIRPENTQAVIKRLKDADAKIPGVKMTRYHEMGTGRGFSLVESDDPVAVTKLALAWSDLVDRKTVPVVEDADIAAALK